MSLNDVKVSVARVEEKLDRLNEVLTIRAQQWDNDNEGRDTKIKDLTRHQVRIEKKLHLWSGVGVGVGAILIAFFDGVWAKFFHAA